jgi:hypothetical protein
MRSIASILVAAAIGVVFAHGAKAGEKIRLAQTSTVTNCMMTCNSTAANCRTTCVLPVVPTAPPSPSSAPAANLNSSAGTTCLLACFDAGRMPDELRADIAVAVIASFPPELTASRARRSCR